MELANGYELQMIKKDVELYGKEGGETGAPQRQKCEKLETKATGDANSSNAITTLQLLLKQVEVWNGKRMESQKQPRNTIRRQYRKYGLIKMEKDMKDGYIGKIGDLMGQYREFRNSKTKIKNLTEPCNGNENKMKKTKVEYDGEEADETGEPQQQKCGKSMPNTDTNDTICCNSSTSTSNGNDKNNNNDNKDEEEEVTGMETNTVTTNDGV